MLAELRSASVILLSSILLCSQDTRISVDVKVVNVVATVRDKYGHLTPDLKKEDFLLEEDGRPQTIRYFSHESALPLSIALVIDVSASQQQVLTSESNASYSFLENVIRPDSDKAAVIRFGSDVDLLQDFTPSKQKLRKALSLIRERGNLRVTPREEARCGFRGTLLYEAIGIAAKKLDSQKVGRKALILFSNGIDVGSCETLNHALESTQRADTIVYATLFSDPQAGPNASRIDGRSILTDLAKKTGGQLFEINSNNSLEKIYGTIEAELRRQYSLGFSSDKPIHHREYRRLSVAVKDSSLKVRARDGYYAE